MCVRGIGSSQKESQSLPKRILVPSKKNPSLMFSGRLGGHFFEGGRENLGYFILPIFSFAFRRRLREWERKEGEGRSLF